MSPNNRILTRSCVKSDDLSPCELIRIDVGAAFKGGSNKPWKALRLMSKVKLCFCYVLGSNS